MKAARLFAYGEGNQFHYEDVETPVPGPGEVLVKVEASSLNPFEVYVSRGFVAERVPLKLPAILGLDLAGTVAALGSGVTGLKVGDRVLGKLPLSGSGANAEYVVATPEQLAPIAANVSFPAAAALPLVGLTGRQVVDALGVKPGERILVTGALGAVGRAAVQYLLEKGAVPVAGVRASRLDEAKALGIEAVALDGEAPVGRFDGAVDAAGGATTAPALAAVKDGGTFATVVQPPADAGSRVKIAHVFAKDDHATLVRLAELAASGGLAVPIAHTLPLSKVGEGHRLFTAGGVGGKIIFVP